LCGISLYIRIALPYDQIFVNDWVWFRETDAYYYIRNIEGLVNNFPHFNSFDPYMCFPGGGVGLVRPFFAWLVAAVTLLVGGGAPTLHTIEVVGAYMPAILGTLTLIPVYFIGKELFNRWVGVMSAALVAILPGEFLHRSLLGFTDHHAAEALFSIVCILFLIMAIKRAREREISFRHILSRDWSTITKPLVYTLLAGIFLGIYLLTWQGGLLFIFIIFAYLVIQFIVDHLGHKSSDYLCIVGAPLFLIAFLMLLPILGESKLDMISRVSLPVAIVVPIVLGILSRFMSGRALKPVYYPLAVLGLAGIGLAALHAINPSLFQSMLSQFSIFDPGGAMLTVLEVQHLTSRIAWYNFTTSFFISFISLAMLIYVAVKEKSADKVLFLVWSIIMLIAVLGQRRFGYYYAVNAALLTGYFSWKMLDLAGLRRLWAKSKEVVGAVKKFKKREKTREKSRKKTFMQPRGVWVRVILVGIVLFFFVFFPNIPMVKTVAEGQIIMEEGWYTSLLWLKDSDNSPEPFNDPDFYYELYPPGDEFEYPETAYGVMSWWDYGYFIMQLAHRIPNSNPGQVGAVPAGQFFIAQNESSAQEIVDQYNLRTRYVAIDYAMPVGKFHAMPEWAGSNVSNFYEAYYYYRTQANEYMPVPLAYPAYYYSMVARLYYFDGKEQPGNNTLVVTYQEQVSSDGIHYKLISSAKIFSSYADAQAYISSQQLTNYNIMGVFPAGNVVVKYEEKVSTEGIHYEEITDFIFLGEPYYDYSDALALISSQQTGNYKILDPFISPVPLEGLENYERVHSSDSLHTFASLAKKLPSVKIFEYLGPDES
ncbi:MAG TPA: oligosaccharyl transferase, archaeosortase A system-associated, partial [Dehalococcoidia bacterium]